MEPSSQKNPASTGSDRIARLRPIDWIKRNPWTFIRIALLVGLPAIVYFQTIAAMTGPLPNGEPRNQPIHVPVITGMRLDNRWDFGYRSLSFPRGFRWFSIGRIRIDLK